jgi:hypothetical protein
MAHYLALLHRAQCTLADAYAAMGAEYEAESEIEEATRKLRARCVHHAEQLEPFARRYGEDVGDDPDDLHSDLFHGPRSGAFGLLRDLHDLYLMTAECEIVCTLLAQAAQGARDRDLLAAVGECQQDATMQMKWCETQLGQRAPQVLVVAR